MMAMTMTPALMSPVQMVMMMVGMVACTSTGAAPVTATRCYAVNITCIHRIKQAICRTLCGEYAS